MFTLCTLTIAVILCSITFRAQSQSLEQMGCKLGGNCVYIPQNVLQLQACGTAGKLKRMHLDNLFLCQGQPNEVECKKHKTDDGEECQWIPYPSVTSPWYPGSCVPLAVSGKKPYFIAKLGMNNFLAGLRKEGLKDEDFPTTKQQNDCQQYSFDEAACVGAEDEKTRRCGWCTGINPLHYPMNPPVSNLCIQQLYIDMGACDALKGELELCPVTTTTTASPSTSPASDSSSDSSSTTSTTSTTSTSSSSTDSSSTSSSSTSSSSTSSSSLVLSGITSVTMSAILAVIIM